jgi:glucose/arabinose dehydrogenase
MLRRRAWPAAILALLAGSASVPAGEARAQGSLRLVSVGSFDSPVFVTAPGGDRSRLFVVEQGGRIFVIRNGRRVRRPFLDIRSRVLAGGERGLFSIAFPPDYASSERFYVYYTDRRADQRIVEFRAASANRANHGSARVILVQQDSESNHNGGSLQFGPDGLLYIGTGDGGGGGDRHGARGNGQSLGSLLGKILRIDPRPQGGRAYRIPSSNPFVGRSGARGEIYSYGLRNPWRFAFDPATGDLAIGDVGQNAVEEIDFVRRGDGAGANFGWRPFEGRQRFAPGESAPGHVPPVIERTHDAGWCSITGGVFVRGGGPRSMRGRYLFGDFCKGDILSARLQRPRARGVRRTGLHVPSLSSFGQDARGRVYATSLGGSVFRLVAG